MDDAGSGNDELRPGARLGDLEIVGHLADGEVVRLWLATTRDLQGRPNALRLVRTIRSDVTDRARHEATLVADGWCAMQVRHRNVARTLAVVLEGPYVVEELVRGPTLARVARTLGRHGFRLPLAWALRVAAGVARGLHSVHRAVSEDGKSLEILHPNLNSSNVILGRDGHPRIIDVGRTGSTRTARADASLGVQATLRFAAPERLRHEPVDVRADLYSLGVLLHDLVTGERLFEHASFLELAERTEPAVSVGERVAGVPEDLETWVAACLDPDPAQRPASAAVVADVLEHLTTLLDAPSASDLGELARVIVKGPSTAQLTELGLDPATGGARWSMSVELDPDDEEPTQITVVTDGPLEPGTVPSLDLHDVLRRAGFSDVRELGPSSLDETRADGGELARHIALEHALARGRTPIHEASSPSSPRSAHTRPARADDTVPFTLEGLEGHARDESPDRLEPSSSLESASLESASLESASLESSFEAPLYRTADELLTDAPLVPSPLVPSPLVPSPLVPSPLVPGVEPFVVEPTSTTTDTHASADDAPWALPAPVDATWALPAPAARPSVAPETRPSRAPSRHRPTEGELAVLDAMVSSDDPETLQAAIRRLFSHAWCAPIATRFQTLLTHAPSDLRARAIHTLWIHDADLACSIGRTHLEQLVERAEEPDPDEPVLLGAILAGAADGERVLDALAADGGAFAWVRATHRRRATIRAHAAAGFELVTRRSLPYSTPAARRAAVVVDERWQLRKRRSHVPR